MITESPLPAGHWSQILGGAMTDRAKRQRGRNERSARSVADVMAKVDRRLFVPPESVDAVGRDAPLPLPCGQTTSQPSLIGLMVAALDLGPHCRVLEVGTGYGYEAAVLSGLAAEVWTIEVFDELADAATQNLASAGISNVTVVTGDGRQGLPEAAPFDAIIVAARADEIAEAWRTQLRPGGRLVAPLGAEGHERCLVWRKTDAGRLEQVGDLGAVRFVPLC